MNSFIFFKVKYWRRVFWYCTENLSTTLALALKFKMISSIQVVQTCKDLIPRVPCGFFKLRNNCEAKEWQTSQAIFCPFYIPVFWLLPPIVLNQGAKSSSFLLYVCVCGVGGSQGAVKCIRPMPVSRPTPHAWSKGQPWAVENTAVASTPLCSQNIHTAHQTKPRARAN